MNKSLKSKIFKFGFVGLFNLIMSVIIQYVFIILLIDILGSFFTAIIIGYLNISVSFVTNKFFVFKTSTKFFFREYLKHLSANILLIFVLSFIFYFFIDILQLSYVLAVILNTLIGITLSFTINYFFTFKS
tara:strand:- start:506 stop:898 length:393 start_codon:yes stop_codon:yes gene_type:complete